MDNDYNNSPDALSVMDVKAFFGIGRSQAYDLANSSAFRVLRFNKRIIIIPKSSFKERFEGKQ